MTENRIPISRIKQAVAEAFHVPLRVMVSQQRDRASTVPRQVAMTLAHSLTHHSNAAVGRLFGDRDHTTVIHARQQTERRRRADSRLDRKIRKIEASLTFRHRPPEPMQLAFLDGPLFDCAPAGAGSHCHG